MASFERIPSEPEPRQRPNLTPASPVHRADSRGVEAAPTPPDNVGVVIQTREDRAFRNTPIFPNALGKDSRGGLSPAHSAPPGRPGIFVQAKLRIGTRGDRYEREADRVAGEIARGQATTAGKPAISTIGSSVAANAKEAPRGLQGASHGSGRPLATTERTFFEPRLGFDFGGVRVHTGQQAVTLSQQVGARAFTAGQHLYFGAGEYAPHTDHGRTLLAHELTHVVQQSGGPKLVQRDDPPKAAVPTKATLIAGLKSTYGLAGVQDDSATWELDELQQVTDAFKLLPAGDVTALKGVTLSRVNSLGGTTAGQFRTDQRVATNATVNNAFLELANLAFKDGAPKSHHLIVHEVGHAVATLPLRNAVQAEHEATVESNRLVDVSNKAVEEFNTAVEERNDTVQPLNDAITERNAALKSKDKARIKAAKADYGIKKKAFDQKMAEENRRKSIMSAAERKAKDGKKAIGTREKATAKLRISAADLKRIAKAAKTAAGAHDKSVTAAAKKAEAMKTDAKGQSAGYLASLLSTSAAIKAFSEATHSQGKSEDDVDTEVATVRTRITARNAARDALAKAHKDNPAAGIHAGLEQAQDAWFEAAQAQSLAHQRSARVQKFAAFVEAGNIAPITDYAAKHWPHKPEEFYAEAYSMFLTRPAELKAASKALHGWFKAKKYLG